MRMRRTVLTLAAGVLLAFLAFRAARAADAPPAVQQVPPNTAEAILGRTVIEANGKSIGRLIDVLVDANGQPEAAVIEFGGFMGVGNRKVAVHWSTLRFNPGDEKRGILLEMTPDQIKAAPEYRSPDKPAPVVTPAAPAQSKSPETTDTEAAPSTTAAGTTAPGTAAPGTAAPGTTAQDTGHANTAPPAAAQPDTAPPAAAPTDAAHPAEATGGGHP
jgi:hypothetical protein